MKRFKSGIMALTLFLTMFAHTDVQVGAQDDYEVDLLKDANNHIYSLAIKAHDLPMSEEDAKIISDLIAAGKVFTDVTSREEYKNLQLEWEYGAYSTNDLLTSIEGVAEYTYDIYGRRIQKKVGDKETLFTYNAGGNLATVQDGEDVLEYCYGECDILSGFWYNDNLYQFVYDSTGMIMGIVLGTETVTVYDFDDSGRLIATYDPYGVGEINHMCYKGYYFDEETGWLYNGRYLDLPEGEFVDGLSAEELAPYIEQYGYNADTLGHMRRLESAMCLVVSNTLLQEFEVVARTINGEAGYLCDDVIAVACVIDNRYKSNLGFGKSAYEAVTQAGQFSAYCNQSDEYLNFDLSATDTRSALIKTLAFDLVHGKTLSKRLSYMNTQFFFCSVRSASVSITEKNGVMYKNGKKISRVYTVMSGAEELTYSKLNKICEQYKGTYAGNVYYNTSL